METDPGSQLKLMATFMSEPTKTIRKAAMDDTYGQTDASTKETLPKMLSTFIFNFRHGKGRLIYTDGK